MGLVAYVPPYVLGSLNVSDQVLSQPYDVSRKLVASFGSWALSATINLVCLQEWCVKGVPLHEYEVMQQ